MFSGDICNGSNIQPRFFSLLKAGGAGSHQKEQKKFKFSVNI